MSCRSTKGGIVATGLARAYSGLSDSAVQSLFHALKREGGLLPDPTEAEVNAWQDRQRVLLRHAPGFNDKSREEYARTLFRASSEEYDPATFYALARIEARARQESVLREMKGFVVDLSPPGSQADSYEYDEDGRPAVVWYASYGSNLSRDRFLTYVSGGTPEGSRSAHPGCRDTADPLGDIPIRFSGRMHFAGNSGRWEGKGVAFMDNDTTGHALGRAYLIGISQFDDVVAQENGREPGAYTINTDEALINGSTSVTNSLYGTLVHIGDYRGAPVFTFTGDFTAREALEASYDNKAWASGTNAPSHNYLRMIGNGLGETFELNVSQQVDYLRGVPGCENLTRTRLTKILKSPADPVEARTSPTSRTIASDGSGWGLGSSARPSEGDWDRPGRLWSSNGVYSDPYDPADPDTVPWYDDDRAAPTTDARKLSTYQGAGSASVSDLRATFKAPPATASTAVRKCPMCNEPGHKMQECRLVSPPQGSSSATPRGKSSATRSPGGGKSGKGSGKRR